MKIKFIHHKANSRRQKELVQVREDRQNILSPRSNFFIREAYKALRTNITFSLADDSECHTIVVTSSFQQEGKSITALNLAISLAQADQKVVVVDCDLRKPKLARLLGEKSEVGLTNVFLDHSLLPQAILHEEALHVDAILSGSIPPNPSELLGSPRMDRILSDLREHYDYIILDSPPVNMVTDAVVLAPKCDGTVFVVRANHSERGAVVHAVEQLEYSKAKILGFVLNDIDMERQGYGYKKYRYGKYRYKSHSKYGYGYGGYGYGYGGYGYGYGYGYERSAEEEDQEASAADQAGEAK